MTNAPFSSQLLETAARLGSATLHEAAGRIGALPRDIKPINPRFRFSGPAFTVDCAALDNLWVHRAIYRASKGDVLVVAPRSGPGAGYWGDILNTAALARGLAALVINGGVRDTTGLVEGKFPVFSHGVDIRGTGKDHTALSALRSPVLIGNVIVKDRDLVVGDADGVVVIPQKRAEEVVTLGCERERDEQRKIALIEGGARTVDLYGFGEQ